MVIVRLLPVVIVIPGLQEELWELPLTQTNPAMEGRRGGGVSRHTIAISVSWHYTALVAANTPWDLHEVFSVVWVHGSVLEGDNSMAVTAWICVCWSMCSSIIAAS